jgi:hypothetical protein
MIAKPQAPNSVWGFGSFGEDRKAVACQPAGQPAKESITAT